MVRNYHKIIPGEGALAGQCFAKAGFGTAVAVSRGFGLVGVEWGKTPFSDSPCLSSFLLPLTHTSRSAT